MPIFFPRLNPLITPVQAHSYSFAFVFYENEYSPSHFLPSSTAHGSPITNHESLLTILKSLLPNL